VWKTEDFTILEPREEQIRDALECIIASNTFADANRLNSFLTYIVEETMAGREANIRAKIIASDVYGRHPENGAEHEAIVRVDAGRLRRRLDVYYSKEGINDQVRIYVLSGGYVPTFEVLELAKPVSTVADLPRNRTGSIARGPFLAALLFIGASGFGAGWLSKGSSDDAPPTAKLIAESSAILEQRAIRHSVNKISSTSLLARTFVEEARELIFPPLGLARIGAAEILCQRAIEIAPELSSGYHCNAFVQAFYAFLTPRGDARAKRILSAKKEAASALRIDPADAYAQMAGAWTQFVDGERKTAISRARIAVGIAPEKEFIRNFYGMMMVFNGQGPELLLSLSTVTNAPKPSDHYHRFMVAGAYFQTGKYQEAIRTIYDAVEIEGRISALMTAILIAAYEAHGNERAAEAYAANLAISWPAWNTEQRLSMYFSEEADALAISNRVNSAVARVVGD